MAENSEFEAKDEGVSVEYEVFKESSAKLIDVLSVLLNEITSHLISVDVMTFDQDEEVMSPNTSKEKAKKLLQTLEGPIKAGHLKSFTELLRIMESHGNDASKQLSFKIKEVLASRRKMVAHNVPSSKPLLTIEDFRKCKTPKKAFRKLSSRMLDYLSHADFYKIRRVCIEDANSPDGTEFPAAFVDEISRTNNINELFDVLAKSHYWNWIDVRMMEAMVDVADIPEAEQMLNDYKDFVSPLKIKQILPDLQLHVVSKNYTTIKEKFKSSDEDTLTVGDILEHQFYLAYQIFDIKLLPMKLCSIQTGCLQLILEIPNESALHAYKSALANRHKFDKIHSLKIGNYPTIYSSDYSPTEVVPELTGTVSMKKSAHSLQTHHIEYYEPPTVVDEFSRVTDQVIKLLQAYDPKLLVEQCTNIMASDKHGINFFSNDQVKELQEYDNTPMLLQDLSHLWSWDNHSVLRGLVGPSDDAVKLLDEFDNRLDISKPIASYPVSGITSIDGATRTVLEMTCESDIHSFSLKDVFEMCSFVTSKCDITRYCLQLLLIQDAVTLHLSIPKSVVHLICTKVLQHSRSLCNKGILEVAIHPDIQINTSKIANLDDETSEHQDLAKQLQHVCRQYSSVFDENQKLKQDANILLKSLQTWERRYKEVEKRYNEMQEDPERITRERIASRCGELKSALSKVTKTLSSDGDKPVKPIIKTEESTVKITTEMQQFKYEINDMQEMIEYLQYYADKVIQNMELSKQQQIQQQQEVNELSMNLSIKEEENTKLEKLLMEKTNEKQDLIKQLQHVRKQYDTALEENRKLKKDESDLLTSLQTWEQKYKELEERSNKVQEDERIKERIANQHSRNKGLIAALGQIIKTIDKDAELPIKGGPPVKDDLSIKAEEQIIKGTTVVEDWRQLEYETDDIHKLIDHLQHCADKVNKNMDTNKQQQNQWTEELEELNTKLSMKDKEIAKLKDERKLLLKSRRENRETSKQPEIKVDKGPYPFQYELLGSGKYGEVYKVHYKDIMYAGKIFHSKFLPGHPNVELPKEFTLKCTLANKFSHPNVEQFVEIAHAHDKGVPMIITELLTENLTAYISRTSDTFHYNQQLSVCNDMAQGLQYLHSQQFVHLNLHGANVLMTSDHHAKIADYLCPLLRTGVALDSTSTAVYQPPESSQHINVQSNVFTLAVLFVQVITKHLPQLEQHNIDLQGVPSCHPLLVFIQRCLSSDVAARPLMRDVCDYLAKLLADKDSTQMTIFKLIHTTEYPPLLPSLTSGRYQLKCITCQNLPVPMYWAYAVTIGMKVYVTGGNSRIGDALEHVFRFDLENNKWDKLLSPSEYHHCVPVVLEGKLSLIGGRIPKSKVVIGMVNTYDEEGNQWVSVYPDMKQPRYRPAVVATDSHVIVLGGKIKERNKLTDTIEIMNIKTKQWTLVATTLPDKMYDMSATISNNLVWIIGYDDGSKRSNKAFTIPLDDLIYLTTTKLSWKQLRSDTICFKTANICYSDPPVILGGDDRQNKTVSAVVAYDPKTESWNEVATLSSPRANCNVVQLPGKRGMLVIGGCSETKSLSHCNSSCLTTTEIYYCNN